MHPPLPRRRILVIYNPVAGPGRRRRLNNVLQGLRDAGCAITLRETGKPGDAEAFARAADANEHDVVLAAGGDGTINEVVNGLGPLAPPLALCPLGTANVLAAEIALATDTTAVLRTILYGQELRVRPGRANGRRFLMMAGVGFDAEVVAGIVPRVKRLLGKGAYVLETFRQLLRYRFPRFRLTIDGVPYEGASAIVARGHFYAGRFVCAPDARLAEPRFQVCLFRKGGPFAVLYYGTAMLLGLVPRLPDVALLAGQSIEVQGPDGLPVQGDGDTVARLPLSVSLDDQPLKLLVP
jgi:YegS/Rv2252/BmrU family lipid kinase